MSKRKQRKQVGSPAIPGFSNLVLSRKRGEDVALFVDGKLCAVLRTIKTGERVRYLVSAAENVRVLRGELTELEAAA